MHCFALKLVNWSKHDEAHFPSVKWVSRSESVESDYFGTKKNIERENTGFTDDFILITLVVIIVIISNLEFIWVSFEYWAKNDLPNLLYDS